MAPTSLPPGFRFHPTDEELVDYYLKRKVHGEKIELEVIPEIDLYKCEPWDLPEKSFLPSSDMEWYFFNLRDKKYPNGLRTNRATEAGYWKATGKDRKVSSHMHYIGMKKTLVFYRGRAPHGSRSNWIMHEYRLDEKQCEDSTYLQDAYSLCRVFKRSGPEPKYGKQYDETNSLYNDIYTVPQELSLVQFHEEIDQTNSLIPSESSSEMMTDIAVTNRWLHFGADEIESCNIYQSPNESTSYHPNVEKNSRFEYEHSVAVPSEIEGHARFFEQCNSSAVEEEDMVEQIYRDARISQKNKYTNQLNDFHSERSFENYERKPNIAQEQENDLFPLYTPDLQDDNLVGLLDMEKQLPFF